MIRYDYPKKLRLWTVLLFCMIAAASVGASLEAYAKDGRIGKTRKYRIIIRVLRPKWRKPPPKDKVNDLRYSDIQCPQNLVGNTNSDALFLQRINKANPMFEFDHVYAKMSFILNADTEWQQPDKFSIQSVRFAVVDRDTKILTTATRGDILFSDKERSQSKSMSAATNRSTNYEESLSETTIQKLYQQRRHRIHYRYHQFYVKNSKKQAFMDAEGAWTIKDGGTICLTHQLPVIDGPIPLLPETDTIFITVTESK